MDLKEQLLTFRENQRKAIREYEAILAELDDDGLIQENETLKRMIGEYREELIRTREQLKETRRENDYLKVALQEQVLDEKRNIIKISRYKLATYFKTETGRTQNALTDLELRAKKQLARLREVALTKLGEESVAFNQRVDQLESELAEVVRRRESEIKEVQDEVIKRSLSRLDEMGAEKVAPEELQKRVRQNQLEMKVGLNLINKIGIFLILLGVGAAFNYSFQYWMPPALKAAVFFLLGGIFLVGGEGMYRKGRKIFSQGLLGGGVSILYGAIFYSYFGLHLISLGAGLVLSVLITAVTVALSLRYDSPTVCGLGLVGGFLPFVTYAGALGITRDGFLAAMTYLFLLNLAVLAVSFAKQWNGFNVLSFILNVPALAFLVFGVDRPWVGVGYMLLTFLMYMVVTMAYPVLHKSALKIADIILLGLNTFVSSIIIYLLLNKAGLDAYHGLTTLVFCLIYLGLGRWAQRALVQEKSVPILFYITALTFAILVIPFQFGIKWLSFGWLVEGLLLIIFGRQKRIRAMEWAGWGINLLCLWIFCNFEYLPRILGATDGNFFTFKYTSVIVGQLLLVLTYAREFQANPMARAGNIGSLFDIFKYATILGLWFYLNYIVMTGVQSLLATQPLGSFFSWTAFALVTFGLGFALTKWELLQDNVVKGFGIFLYVVADLVCVVLNLVVPVLRTGAVPGISNYLAIGLLVLYNLVVLVNLRALALKYIDRNNLSLEIYPMVLGLYLLGNLTGFLTVQFNLGAANLWFSFVYLALAIGYIIYGFARKFVSIRRFGLILVLFATAKLFLYDLSFLETLGRIIAYFGFGLVLLLISFIYQKVKNSMESQHDNQAA